MLKLLRYRAVALDSGVLWWTFSSFLHFWEVLDWTGLHLTGEGRRLRVWNMIGSFFRGEDSGISWPVVCLALIPTETWCLSGTAAIDPLSVWSTVH